MFNARAHLLPDRYAATPAGTQRSFLSVFSKWFLVVMGCLVTAGSLGAAVDLTVTQTDSPDPVGVGTNFAYSITVSNVGTTSATGVHLTNPLAPGLTFQAVTSSQGSCSNDAGIVRCNLGNLAAAQRAVVTLTVRAQGPGFKDNTATAASNEADAVPDDNSVTEGTAVLLFGGVLSNPQAMTLPELEGGPASLYPSVINVSGLTTTVYGVTVTLHNLSHSYPDDLDILLVEPGGAGILLMSDAGGDAAVSGVTITFDDAATDGLPDTGLSGPITSRRYRPTNFGATDQFAAPSPGPPYGNTMFFFEGINPNGAWSLYVLDDTPEDAGAIAGGWSMRLTTVQPFSDLGLQLTDSPDPVNVGSNLSYTIVITNKGPSAARDVAVENALPLSVNLISAVATQGVCTNQNGLVHCALGLMTNRSTATITLVVQPTAPGTITNLAYVDSANADVTPGNDEMQIATVVRPVADIALGQSASSAAIYLQQEFSYTVQVTNLGPFAATAVVLSNALSPSVAFVSAGSSQGSCAHNGGVVTCSLGTLAASGTAAIAITVRGTATGSATNRVSVIAVEADINAANNSSVLATSIQPAVNIGVTQAESPRPGLLGSLLTYTLTVSNQGPSSATSVIMTDALAASAAFMAVQSSQGGCVHDNGLVTCTLGSIAPGATATVAIQVRPGALGMITNQVSLTSGEFDTDPRNNTSALATRIDPAADLDVTSSESADPLLLGQNLSYAVQLRNLGASAATNVRLTNQLPAGATFVSAVPSQGSCSHLNGIVTCSFGVMASNALVNVAITLTPTATGTATNRISVGANEADPNLANNIAVDTTLVLIAAGVFSSPNLVTIPTSGAATPYPSTIFVSGVTVRVDSVTVTLSNVQHVFPDDIDVLLVGPQGQSVILMADAGGGVSINNVSLTFSDNAAVSLPDATGLSNGVYRAANYDGTTDTFPAPAPAGPYGTNLSVFRTIDPNGTWSLYVLDDADKDAGQIVNGWTLAFSTFTSIADIAVMGSGPAAAVVGTNVAYTLTVTNKGPSAATDLFLTNTLPAGAVFVSAGASQGGCSNLSGRIVCGLGTVDSAHVATIGMAVSFPSLGMKASGVRVEANEVDPDRSNNTVSLLTDVIEGVVINQQPVSLTVSNGLSATFQVVASGGGPLSYQWLHNGTNIPGATGATLTLPSVSYSDAGTYVVRVLNPASVMPSSAATLNVLAPPTIINHPQSRTNFAGSVAVMLVTAGGSAPLRYQWYYQGNPLANATNASLSFSASLANAGVYHVTVTNEFGGAVSQSATLTVWEADFGDAPSGYGTTVAQGGAYHFLVPGVFLGQTIDFDPDGRPTGGSNGDDTNGLDDEDGVRFVTPLYLSRTSTVEVVASTSGFLNGWLDLNANASWAQAGEQIFVNQPLAAGTNILSLEIPAGATPGPTHARFRFSTASGLGSSGPGANGEVEDYAVTLLAVADVGLAVSDSPDPVAVGNAFTYTIIVTNHGPGRASTVSVSDTLPSGASYVSSTASRGSCMVQSGIIVCSLGSISVAESVVVTITATYGSQATVQNTAQVSAPEADLNLANNTVVTTTSIQVSPTITLHPQNQTVAVGGSATLAVAGAGTGPLRYQWFFDGNVLVGATNDTLVISNAAFSASGNYLARISNDVGNASSLPAQLRVGLPPVAATESAQSVTSTGAVLRAAVNPQGLNTTVWFEWGSSPAYGNTTAGQTLSPGTNVVSVGAAVSGYLTNTPYHFRVVASNSLGRVEGVDRTFVWSSLPVPRITHFAPVSGGRYRIEFTGSLESSQVYRVQGTLNFTSWTTLGTASAAGGGNYYLEVTPDSGRQFYRIISP